MKNEMVRYGGIAPSQWVLGRFPRDATRMLEENEIGQLGAIREHMDSTTEFGLKAKFRLASMTAFVRQDCGRRYMRAMSRNAGPILKDYHVGDLLMFRKEQGMDWFGPARVLGKEDKVLWCLHQGVPVAAAMNRVRPANTAEILAHMCLGQGLTP
eukprot:3194904-Lingulodinium_polyedra.AAC.1